MMINEILSLITAVTFTFILVYLIITYTYKKGYKYGLIGNTDELTHSDLVKLKEKIFPALKEHHEKEIIQAKGEAVNEYITANIELNEKLSQQEYTIQELNNRIIELQSTVQLQEHTINVLDNILETSIKESLKENNEVVSLLKNLENDMKME